MKISTLHKKYKFLRKVGFLSAFVVLTAASYAQTIVDGTWYNSYSGTNDFSAAVGYQRYGYFLEPGSFKDAGYDGINQNVAGDLLPTANEIALGDPNQATNPESNNLYSVIWSAAQFSTTVPVDLMVFELNGLSQVSSASLITYFHNNLYNVPKLTFSINTSSSLAAATWVDIGTYDGKPYNSSGPKPVPISLSTSTSGYYIKVSALSNLGDPATARNFDLAVMTFDSAAVPEPTAAMLLMLSAGFLLAKRRQRPN